MTPRPATRCLQIGALASLIMAAAPAPVRAQQPLSDVLSFLLTNQSVATGDFVKDAEAARATRDTLTQLLLAELTTLPLGSSSAGFTYRFNAELGTEERTSESFGAFFTERVSTAGRGHATVGATLRIARFTELDGVDLRDGRFMTTGNQFRDEREPFDIETMTLDLESRTLTLVGSVGLTDRLDLGVAVPMVSLSLEGERVNTYYDQRIVQARAQARVSGVGDLAVRAKYALWERRGSGIGVIGDLRLPTGREEDLLGAGEPALRALVVSSIERGTLSVYGNGSFTLGGPVDEIGYRSAVTISASPVVTFVGELVGRRVADGGRMTPTRIPHPTLVDVDTIRLVPLEGSVATAAGLLGVKWNVASTWLAHGHVWWPLTHSGLRSTPMIVAGLEYSFGQ